MAKPRGVWAIDLGQCALKALRCTSGDDPAAIVAEEFDYIEYPQFLNQPEADSAELIREAIGTFLSRHAVRGDRVAIAVPGQSGLSRFIRLPPVEASKIPDMVWFEARQNIPFALEEVVWDYQQMGGGVVSEGFTLGTEVGLFAIKREQLAKALRPFDDADIEVDIVQLAPLAIYNHVVFDHMPDLPPPEEFDADHPPPSLVVLSMGTEASDVVITNGYRLWQRSVPVGGNHFTKAMTKELKLTFAKAEHLKRNASRSVDAVGMFQALRPVFSDLVAEVQRTIGYFTNIDRNAQLSGLVVLGDALKLLGLSRFLEQSLGLPVSRIENFRGLTGAAVLDDPLYREHAPSFGVCYGLALQALRDVRIKTNLIPPEVVRERLIRAKKPWTVAASALLLMGLAFSFGGGYRAYHSVHPEMFGTAMQRSDEVTAEADRHVAAYKQARQAFEKTQDVSENLVYNVEGRLLWLEIMKAINVCLPDPGRPDGRHAAAPSDISNVEELQITQIECQKFADLANWWNVQRQWYSDPRAEAAAPVPAPEPPRPAGRVAVVVTEPGAAAADHSVNAQRPDDGPSGPGWVIQLSGHHFHNTEARRTDNGNEFLMRTLIAALHQPTVNGVPVGDLGISHALSVNPPPIDWWYEAEVADDIAAVDADGEAGQRAAEIAPGGLPGGPGRKAPKRTVPRPLFVFTVQFCWRETPPSKRASPVEPGPSPPTANSESGEDGVGR
jgi:type IV pilus assembly protein PilM